MARAMYPRALRAAGADWFGVSNLDEALQIRKAGISESILILGYTPPKEAARLAAVRHYPDGVQPGIRGRAERRGLRRGGWRCASI